MIQIIQADLSNLSQAEAILELLNNYAQHPMGGGEPLSNYTKNNLLATLSERADYVAILAYDGSKAIGLCNCFENFSTFSCKPILNIHDVFVSDGYRGKKVATKMMQKAENIARKKGYCKMTLEVLNHNKAAKASYSKQGYSAYELNAEYGQAEFWQKQL